MRIKKLDIDDKDTLENLREELLKSFTKLTTYDLSEDYIKGLTSGFNIGALMGESTAHLGLGAEITDIMKDMMSNLLSLRDYHLKMKEPSDE